MNIVFMGTPDFAVRSLEAVHNSGHAVKAVVTIPDKKQGRGLKIKASPVKTFALQHQLPVLQPDSFKDEAFIEELRAIKADIFVVVAFKILPPQIFQIPPKGTINVHGSLLPAYRGAAPINWAIMNGDSQSGITTMHINAKVDTGDMLLQDKVAIDSNMTAGDLHDILADKGAQLLVKTLDLIAQDAAKPIPQDENLVSKAPKINANTMLVNFNAPAGQVHNQIRGLSPYPAAFSFLHNKKIKLFKSAVVTFENIKPAGTISFLDKNALYISCKEGTLSIGEVQLEGKRKMSVSDFLNGYPLKVGDCFKNSKE